MIKHSCAILGTIPRSIIESLKRHLLPIQESSINWVESLSSYIWTSAPNSWNDSAILFTTILTSSSSRDWFKPFRLVSTILCLPSAYLSISWSKYPKYRWFAFTWMKQSFSWWSWRMISPLEWSSIISSRYVLAGKGTKGGSAQSHPFGRLLESNIN